MRQRHLHGDEQILALWRQAHSFKDSYDDVSFTPADVSAIATPTLIVHGDRDPFYPLPMPVEMHQAIPRSYLWIVPNAGHDAIFRRIDEFRGVAVSFLRGEWECGA